MCKRIHSFLYASLGVAFLLLPAAGCGPQATESETMTASPAKNNWQAEIEGLMQAQERAWNQGEIEGFMEHYWKSDSLCFIGSKGLTYGWDATLQNYRTSYPNPEAMGTLRFTQIKMDSIHEDAAYVVGKWQLFRSADTLSGHYSLLWKKLQGAWRITADHSS